MLLEGKKNEKIFFEEKEKNPLQAPVSLPLPLPLPLPPLIFTEAASMYSTFHCNEPLLPDIGLPVQIMARKGVRHNACLCYSYY